MKRKVLMFGISLLSLLGCTQSNEDRVISFYKDYYESRYCELSDVSIDSIRVLDTKDIKQEAQLLYDSLTYYNTIADSIDISKLPSEKVFYYYTALFMIKNYSFDCSLAIKDLKTVISSEDSKLTEIFIQYKTMDDSLYNDIVYTDEDFSSFYVIEDIDKFESDTLNTPLVKEIIKYRSIYFAVQKLKEENEKLLFKLKVCHKIYHEAIQVDLDTERGNNESFKRQEIKENDSLEDSLVSNKIKTN